MPKSNDTCFAIGWGQMEEFASEAAENLMEVSVPILSTCKYQWTNDTFQICAGLKQGGRDSCQGITFRSFMQVSLRQSKFLSFALNR